MGQQTGKKLPHRAAKSHPSHARRERSKTRGKQRKLLRRVLQAERQRINDQRRAAGEPTPWEIACQRRQLRRAGVGV